MRVNSIAVFLFIFICCGSLTGAAASPEIISSFSNISVYSVLKLSDGNLLLGTSAGLIAVDSSFNKLCGLTTLDGLPGSRVYSLARSGSIVSGIKTLIYVGTEKGLACVYIAQGKTGITLKLLHIIHRGDIRVLLPHLKGLLIGTWGQGVFRLDEKETLLDKIGYTVSENLMEKLRITGIANHNDQIYVSTAGSGLYVIKNGFLVPANLNLPNKYIYSIIQYNDMLLTGTAAGLTTTDRNGTEILSNYDIRSFVISGNRLVAGSCGQGLFSFYKDAYLEKIDFPAPTQCINSIFYFNDLLFAGTDSGLYKQAGPGVGFKKQFVEAPISENISALAGDSPGLWIGTFDNGLFYLKAGHLKKIKDPVIDNRINALAFDTSTERPGLWVGTARGLVLIKGDKTIRYTIADGLPNDSIHSLFPMADGGMIVGAGRRAAVIRDGRIEPYADKQGIPNRGVWATLQDKHGTIWFGSAAGLYCLDPGKKMKRYSVAGGHLKDGWITALALDKSNDDCIWIGTYSQGVTRLTRKKNGETEVHHFGGGYINPAGLVIFKNHLYAATMEGLLVMDLSCPDTGWKKLSGISPGKDITAILPDNNKIWIGSRRGLSLYPP